MILVLRFFLAPTSCDKRLRRRMEAAIAQALYASLGNVGTFQDHGIRYEQRMKSEQPVACIATSPVPLLGLPEQLLA